jgi:hypothetical protein
MTNDKAIELLQNAGYMLSSDLTTKSTEFAEIFKKRKRYVWQTGTSGSYAPSAHGYYENFMEYNYMIPMTLWKKHVNPKFRSQFKLGTMVRINQNTSRKNIRNKYNQAIGDGQDFKHLGIGSGKEYNSDDAKEIMGYMRGYHTQYNFMNTQILIGNRRYPVNLFAADHAVKWYKANGYVKRYSHYTNDIKITDLVEYKEIKADGIFGPKQRINGYITNIFVHFLYPKWHTKRECRYEITLDTGAKGIWTNDYLQKTYTTDYDVDEALMKACTAEYCNITNCDHKKIHIKDHDCTVPCNVSGHICTPIFDYSNLFDTTHGMGLTAKGEKE